MANVIRSGTPTQKLNREFGNLFDEPSPDAEFVEPTTADLKMFNQWKKLDRSGDAIGAVKSYRLTPTFVTLSNTWERFSVVTGPVGCLAGESRIWTEHGLQRMDYLYRRGKPFRVWSRYPDGSVGLEWATAPFEKGRERLCRIDLEGGGFFRGAVAHLVQLFDGEWKKIGDMSSGERLMGSLPYREVQYVRHGWRREPFYDLTVESTGNYIGEWGVVHHNSGKSTMSCLVLMMRCCSQMPCYDGVVRNRALFARGTYEELKTTTMDTWMHLFPQTRIKLSYPIEGKLNFTNNGEPHILQFDAFGFDADNVENKLRSRAYSIGFGNELQYFKWLPIDVALERMGRYPFADMAPPAARAAQRAAMEALDRGEDADIGGYFLNLGFIGDTNSPIADSWLYERAEILRPPRELYLRQPPAMFLNGDARTGWKPERNTGQREGIARAENVENHNEGWDYYENMWYTKPIQEFRQTVCNEYGRGVTGDAVFQEFNRDIHLMDPKAAPEPGLPWLFGADNGLNPAFVAGQFNRWGQLCVYWCVAGSNTSTQRFFRERVLPGMALFNFTVRNKHALWADPANDARAAAADDEVTSLTQILALGFSATSCPVPRNALRVRINTVKDALTRFVDGKPAILFHPVGCKDLVKAMGGGYHYKTPKRATTTETISLYREPEKNADSDLADSLQYLVCGFFAEGATPAPYTRGANRGETADPAVISQNALYGQVPI